MSPSLEAYEEVTDHLPVKPVATNINLISAVADLKLEDNRKHDFVLRYFRAYIADLCEQFKGGHPGYVKIH
jgi:dihydroxyacetone synthase